MSNREQLTQEFGQWIEEVKKLETRGEKFWDQPLGEGKWTVREMVSHMVEWDRYSYENGVQKVLLGEETTFKRQDDDLFNAKAAERGKERSAAELTADAIEIRQQLIEAYWKLSDEDFAKTYTQANGEKFQATEQISGFTWHDRHHMAQVNALEKATSADNR